MTTDYYSELHAVDIGLGVHILDAFSDLQVSGPSEFVEYLSRDPKKQVFRHDADDVQGFIKSYMASGDSVSTISAGKTVRTAKMPVVYYCRKPGLVSDDENLGGIFNKLRWVLNNETDLHIRLLAVVLTYRLAFITRDKPSLDKMGLAWFSHVSNVVGKGGHKFSIQYKIDEEVLDCNAFIKNPKMITFDDESVTTETGHFFAVGATVEVEAPVIFGDVEVLYDPLRIQALQDAIK